MSYTTLLAPNIIALRDDSGWDAKVRAYQQSVGQFLDDIAGSAGAVDSSQIATDNTASTGSHLEASNTSGGLTWKNTVAFNKLPGSSDFSTVAVVRVKSDLSGIEPVPALGIDFGLIDYAGTPSGNKLIIHNGTKPELVSYIPPANIQDGAIDYTKLRMIGTPLEGYFQKFTLDTSGNMCLIAAPSANTEDSGMIRATVGEPYKWFNELAAESVPIYESNKIKYTATDTSEYGDTFLSGHVPNYSNLSNIGQVYDTTGSLVQMTSASYFGKILHSSGYTDTKYFSDYALTYFKESGALQAYADDAQIAVGLRRDVSFLIDKTFDGCSLYSVKAQTHKKGVTGSSSIQILRRRLSESMGSSTTRFDITSPGTPNASTRRYTWDGTGTDPAIADSDASLRAGDYVMLYAQNFTVQNQGLFKITAAGTNWLEITNIFGLAENDKTIGTGYIIPIKKMLSTELTLADVFDSENGVVYTASNRKTLASGDVIMPEITATHTTLPYGLVLSYRFGGINVSA